MHQMAPNDLEQFKVKVIHYMFHQYPRVSNFTLFGSLISSFQDSCTFFIIPLATMLNSNLSQIILTLTTKVVFNVIHSYFKYLYIGKE